MIDYILAFVLFVVLLTLVIVVDEFRFRKRTKDYSHLLRKEPK